MGEKLQRLWGYAWTRLDVNGEKFISLVFKDSSGTVRRCNVFPNRRKAKETHPDWIVNEKIKWR